MGQTCVMSSWKEGIVITLCMDLQAQVKHSQCKAAYWKEDQLMSDLYCKE
jgi:hypothetical protein